MTQPVEDFFERELALFGERMRNFARRYPAEASRLVPDPNRLVDPHLERFIEGFALLTARIHHKLDSEFPELSESLLQILYPNLLAPVPSMGTAQLGIEAPAAQPQGVVLPRHTGLRTRPLGRPAMPCRWRTGYPVTLWPVQVTSAQVLHSYFPTGLSIPPRTQAVLVLRLECLSPWKFSELDLDRLRFFLGGDRQVIATLYEVLFNHTIQVAFRAPQGQPGQTMLLPPDECLQQVGFEPDEALLPLAPEAFEGYRLLTEFLSFRDKFLYVDLGGWRQVRAAGIADKVEVVFFLSRAEENLEQGVTARTFQLGCTPIINLFEKSAEPLAVTQKATEYRVVPSRTWPMGMEVFSIDAVAALDPERHQLTEFQPFYAVYPGEDRNGHAFWYAGRRPSNLEGDRGTEAYLTLVDSEFDPRLPAEAVLDVRTTCFNRNWPVTYQRAGEALFPETSSTQLPGPAVCLHSPTLPLRPGLSRASYWRLIAQNNLNHASLTDPDKGCQALQEMLRLCDFSDVRLDRQLAQVNQQVIDGIRSLKCRPVQGQVTSGPQIGYCRGVEATVEFDEKNYVGVGLFLFACVLERFLGLYAGINSFSQLIARTSQAEGYLKKWPPRAANNQLR
jgi:type VI secretion system protein ImpG